MHKAFDQVLFIITIGKVLTFIRIKIIRNIDSEKYMAVSNF